MKAFFAAQIAVLAVIGMMGAEARAQTAQPYPAQPPPQPYPAQPYPPQPYPYPPQPYPPQPYPPPSYYAPPPQPPARLPYTTGQPIPQGYQLRTHARRGLVIGGSITFGVLYLFSIIAADASNRNGHHDDDLKALYVPAIGPFIAAANSDTNKSVLVLDGVGQVAGLAMFISGFAFPQTELVRNDLARVRLLPMVGQGKTGVTLNVVF
jgi:hypothetical protein